jgi:hypothetical protein
MREITRSKTNSDLAAYLGISKSTVANWIRRDTVPYEEVVKIAIHTGASVLYILFGEGSQHANSTLAAPDEEIMRATLGALTRLRMIAVPARSATQREAALDLLAREAVVYYHNAMDTLYALVDRGMPVADARRMVAKSVYPKTDEGHN